jgi:two-component system sensor histidine kinase BaeS
MVRWDAKRIEQLVSNLLENSLRYTDAPGEIHIRLAAHDKHVYIDIEDSAPGVTVEELPKLFEPLYRVDMARSRDSGGSGLGLAICKAIVQAHRGSVEAKPSALGGLQIHIELPLSAEVST